MQAKRAALLARADEVSRRRREVVRQDPESGLAIYVAPLRIGHLDEPGGGWLSPDGKFYRCPDVCHIELARRLALDFGWIKARTRRGVNQADARLDRAGWARIWDDGSTLTDGRKLTQAQLDVMWDLAQRHPSMREKLLAVFAALRQKGA